MIRPAGGRCYNEGDVLRCNLKKACRKEENEVVNLPEKMAGDWKRHWPLKFSLPAKKVEELLAVPSSDGRCLPKLKEGARGDGPVALA